MSIVTINILMIFVLPKFVDFFDGLGAKLPLSTRMLLAVGEFSEELLVRLPARRRSALGVVGLWLQKTSSRQPASATVSCSGCRIVGDIVLYSVIERILPGPRRDVAGRCADPRGDARRGHGVEEHRVRGAKLQPAQERILEGEGLAEPIAATELFPRAAVQMMRVGESTGTLDQQLENAAEYYARELDYKLKRLTTLFEPAVIVFMGIVVGFVAIALVQAMYGIYNSGSINNL